MRRYELKDVFRLIASVVALLILGVLFYTTLIGIVAIAVYVLTTSSWWINIIGVTLGFVCAGVYVFTAWAHREKHIQINEVLELDNE